MNSVKVFLIIFTTFCLSISIELLFNVVQAGHLPIDSNWSVLIDSLESWGANVDTVELYKWSPDSIFCYDKVWIIGEGLEPFFSEAQMLSLINYVKSGKPISIFVIVGLPHRGALDDLVKDEKWSTTIRISSNIYFGHTPGDIYISKMKNFLNFFLLRNVDSLTFVKYAKVECGNNCYPFVVDFNTDYIGAASTDYTLIRSAICYPFIKFNICSYITIQNGFHMWEDVEYHEPEWNHDNFELTKNILLAPSHFDFPCPVPEPYQISVTSIPPCANTGDTVRICGRNLWRGKTESLGGDIEIYIGATEMVPHDYDTLVIPIRYAPDSTWLEFIMPDLPPGTYPIRLGHKAITFYAGEITVPCPMHADIFPECADPGDVITISGENLVEPISITMGDSVVSAVSYSDDRSKVSFRCPWLPRGRYRVNLSWHDMFIASGTIEIPCPHRCERFPNPITPNFDAINDFAQFEFDGIFVKPAQIHIFDIHGHEIRTIDVPAGLSAKQHARWDGTDDGGNPVPEGVYIYTIEVAGEIVCEGTVTVAR